MRNSSKHPSSTIARQPAPRIPQGLLIKVLVNSMMAVTALSLMPWPPIAAWFAVAVLVAALEEYFWSGRGDRGPGLMDQLIVAWPRIAQSTLYAVGASQLITHGGPGTRLVAFAVMACSMTYVVMRYYRSPVVFLTSISPYAIVLCVVGYRLGTTAFTQGKPLLVLIAIFPLVIFGILLWAARGQLAASRAELVEAMNEARERARAADAANCAKSEFLAMMSHEFRTPLNGVLGLTEALLVEDLSASQRERLKVVRRSGESLLAILNDLLDLSKVEECAFDLEIVDFDVEHLVRGLAAVFQPAASKKGLAIEIEVAKGAHVGYLGDAARVRRALHSLVDNAVKFTHQGTVTLSVEDQPEGLVFHVADTGIGIAPEHLARLGESFFQADSSFTRRNGGAGLGLAICRRLATTMGGLLEATSTPGLGSTFTLRIPLSRGEPAPIPQEVSAPTVELPELRILVAEDNETNRLVLKNILMQAGINPTFAVDGRAALEAWKAAPWDMVLMDIQMPEMDGVTATRAIRRCEAEQGLRRTPIVAVTANAMTHQIAEYEAAGMDGIVAKPVQIAKLFAAIEAALDDAEDQAAERAA